MEIKTQNKIWLSAPHMGGAEIDYVNQAFSSNWIAPVGPNINEFEKDISNYLAEGKYVAALCSGTASIHLGLKLLNVTQGDVVLCQSMTFAASANPIKYLNARPVFIDSETSTWNMCPLLLEKAIKEHIAINKKPKAILAVHLYGMPYKIREIHELANKYQIPVLEDSAEALGSTFEGRKCGVFGNLSIFSFNGNKIITTSGGGALVCNSQSIKEEAVFFATQAKDNFPHYQHTELGFNYRMSNVIAGIGRGQMEVLEQRVESRRQNFEYYKLMLSDVPNISFLEEPQGSFSNRWLTTILTDSFTTREKIRIALDAENIESRPLWKPMHSQPLYVKEKSYINGVSDELFDKGLCLPSGSNLNKEDIELVVSIIKTVIL